MVQKIKLETVITVILWGVIKVLCFSGIVLCIHFSQTDKKILQKDNGYIYLAPQHESSPLTADIQQLVNFRKELQNADCFQYYEIYGQPLYTFDIFLPEFERAQKMNNERYSLDTLQTGPSVLNDFGVTLQDGRGFGEKDFVMERNGGIPVIIGAEWSERLKTGDCFQAEYLYDTYQFYVIGVLQPQAMIYMTNRIYPLDNYIIMPSFEIVEDIVLTEGLKIHYANKVSGIAKVENENQKYAQQYLLTCIENTSSGVYSWYATTYDCNLQRIPHLGTTEIFILCNIIFFVVIVSHL